MAASSTELTVQIVGFVLGGGALTALVAWLVSRRQHSGRVDTSEAASLWAESQAMRQELRAEVIASRGEVSSLRTELAEVRAALSAVRAEADRYREESAVLRARISALEVPTQRGGAQ